MHADLVLPGSPRYEHVRKPALPRFHDARPQAVALCRTAAEVGEAISFARGSGLDIAVRGGGHCFAGRSSTRGLVIDVSPMRSVAVSGELADVGAGVRLGELYEELAHHGRAIAGGCGPTVGIAGLTLGGGLGLLGRKHGLTADQLAGAEVVLADGSVVECDEQREADLFWALRGAGSAGFGVVTSFRFRTVPEPAATAFHLVWPHEHAAALIGAWQSWAPAAPEEMAASLLVTAGGEAGRPPRVHLFGAMADSESRTDELLEELASRAGAEPQSSLREHMPYGEIKGHLAGRGPGEDEEPADGLFHAKSEYFRQPLPADAIAALVEHLPKDRPAGQARKLDFMPWGGAYNRVPADATAFPHRDELFLLAHDVIVAGDATAAETDAARGWLAESWALAHPWGSGGVYPNFPDPDLADEARAYYGDNRERVLRLEAKYDPAGLFG